MSAQIADQAVPVLAYWRSLQLAAVGWILARVSRQVLVEHVNEVAQFPYLADR